MSANDAENSLDGGATYGGAAKRQQGEDISLGGEATFAGQGRRQRDDVSLGDERTLGGDLSDLDTAMDDIEVVDLASRYRTEGTLGRGGMGEVLLATDTRLDRKVAIKRILGEAARSRTAVSRFLTEAKSIAALNHPNIVQIYDYGRAADGPFLIMEYVDGSSLLDRCRGEAIPLDEAVELACQLCDGLAKAHDLGIIHRDIKPANVLLTKDGTPKLTDFGLAKAEANDHGQTMTGAVLGTPDFMPPEQRRDAALVDARSDLWSLAATVYQMVTGKSPKIIRFKDVPEAIQEVLGRALEDEKDARYQTVREFRDALKVSLRAATAPAAVSLGEGQCPGCGTKNDSSRKFCRNCGGSLEAPCLSCDKGMPYWEEICGQCGTKQEPLIAERRSAMAASQAEAESLLNELHFDAADRIAVALHGEKDPRFNQFVDWAEKFLPKIQRSRDEQRTRAAALLTEAIRHEEAFDYLSAIHALEQVPTALRSEVLPENDTSVAVAFLRVMRKQEDCERLEAKIKTAITSRELGSLMPDVESFLRLKPDRKDVQKVKAQLEERHAKLVTQRDDAIARAKKLIDKHEYPAAVAALTAIDRSVENVECGKVRERAEGLLRQVQQLRGKIKQAVAEKRLDGLLANVDVLLQLLPGNVEAQKLKESLIAREEKVEADLVGLRKNVDAAWQACRFADVMKGLERIPEVRRTVADTTRLDQASDLVTWQTLVAKATAEASDLDSFATALRQGRVYAGMLGEHSLKDPAARDELVRCEREHLRFQSEHEQAARLRRVVMFYIVPVAVFVALVTALLTAGFWVRSSMRAQALETAIAQRRWDGALKIDPGNPTALIGQAIGRLGGDSDAVAAAFKDLEAAEARGATMPELTIARAEAIAARGREHAKAGRLSEAEKDYAEAKQLWAAMPSENRGLMPMIRNSIGTQLKLIPAGLFMMGQAGDRSDETRHQVTLTKAFYIGVYEVTNAEWERVMGSVPSKSAGDNFPVESVSWEDATEFCQKLSALPEERAAGLLYRLPTEAEWEYACRAGTTTQYSFGDDEKLLGDHGWFDGNSGLRTHPVGEKTPNGFSLYDMHGNVWEWCSDWYGDYPDGGVTDPQGSPSGGAARVNRGGCFDDSAGLCRSAFRRRFAPSRRYKNLGFRLAASPSGIDPVEEVGK